MDRLSKEAYLGDVPVLYRALLTRALDGKCSPRQAIKAKCLDCCCFDREEVATCTIECCPNWRYRPYQVGKVGRATVGKVAANLPKSPEAASGGEVGG